MQGAAADTVGALQELRDVIDEVNEVATSISAAVEEQTAATSEIGRNISEAAQRTDDVSRDIVEVTRGTEKTRAAALSVLDIARGLSEESGALSSKVDSFVSGLRTAS